MKSFIVFSTIATAAGQSKLNFEVSGESSSIGVEAVALDNLELTCGSGESASTSNLCGVATTKSDVATLSARLDALEITTNHLVRVAGFANSTTIAAHVTELDAAKCNLDGVDYAVGATVQMPGSCPHGCGVQHPCLIKPYGGFTAAEKDACMGPGTGGNKVEQGNHVFQWVRDTKCDSFTDWSRAGEQAYSRTNPGTLLTNVIESVIAHGAAWPKGMIDTTRDRYALCRTNSAQSVSTAYDLLEPTSGSPTQAFDACRDFRLGHVSYGDPTLCLPNNQVRQTATGQGFQMKQNNVCQGTVVPHATTASLYGAFQMYENKGPMANAKHATNEQYFDPALDSIVSGFQAAKDACLSSQKCGGIFKAHGSLSDAYYVNTNSKSTYDSEGYGENLGHWSHDFSASTGYDVWVRQGFTTSDLMAICEQTASCGCLSVRLAKWDSGSAAANTHSYHFTTQWTMHEGSTQTAANNDYDSIIKTTAGATLPPITGPVVTGTCTLSGDGTAATFVTGAATSCVPNCAPSW
jgi:hypothetical protein